MAIIIGNSQNNTLNGTAGSDIIVGAAGNDTINAGGGDNVVDAGAGNDTVTSGNGNDVIDGGAGNDVINAGGGTNIVDGGAGNDTITTGDGIDLISGGAGDDTIGAGGGANVVDGGAGNDRITTGDGLDLIDGGAGDDIINAGGGANVIAGGAGNDTITSGDGLDLIDAGAGNDTIDSGSGCDLVLAGAGDDTVIYTRVVGSDDYALFVGEAGRDTLRLVVSRTEYDGNAALRAEIAAYQAFLASNAAQRQSFTFRFGDGEARLTVSEFERLDLVITGSSNAAPVAVADTGTAGENETRSFDVLANDTDANAGDTKTLVSLGSVTVTSANGAINGISAAAAFAIVGNQIRFTPGTQFDALAVGQTATATVTYTMRDAVGATSTSTLTLTITGANDAPVASGAVAASIVEDDPAATVALLANASDVDQGDDLDVSGVSYAVTQGTWAAPVAYSVDPETRLLSIDPAQFAGLGEGDTLELTFSYSVTDGNGGSAPATAVVTVTGRGDGPVITAGNDSGAVVEDGPLVVSGDLGVSDVDFGDGGTWTAGTAAYGTVAIDASTGEWTYTLDNGSAAIQGLGQGDALADSFEVTVTDSDGLIDVRTVNIAITGTGDAPVIAVGNDTGAVVEDGTEVATGNLDVSDADTGDSATWTAGAAGYGTVEMNALAGEWKYTLNNAAPAVQGLGEGDALADSFQVTVTDGDGLTDVRTINITITGTGDGPVIAAGDDGGSVVEDGTSVASGDLGVSDTDVSDSATWTAGAAAYGSVAINPLTGEWTYTLNNATPAVQGLGQGDALADSFVVTVTDSDGLTDVRTIHIAITGTGDAPVIAAGNDTGAVVEDGVQVATGNLDVSDADLGDSATWTAGTAAHGAVAIDATSGAWTYTLNNGSAAVQGLGQNDPLADSFQVTVTDSDGLTAVRTVTIAITGTGDAPVIAAGNDTGAVVEDGVQVATGNLDASDTDIGDSATWTAGAAAYGSVAINAASGEWTYTLNNALPAVQDLDAGEPLDDSFVVTVTDGDGLTAARTVNITISGTADNQPTAFGDTVFTNAAAGTTLSLLNAWLVRNDVDPNSDPLTVGAAFNGTNVDQVTAGATATSIWTNIAAGSAGAFSYKASDGAELSTAAATVVVSRGAADNTITGGAGNDIVIDGRTDQTVTTLDGGAGSDIIVGGSTTNTIVADHADLLIDGGGGTDTLHVATAFDDVSDGQIVNVERATVAAGGSLNLAQQTEGLVVTGSTGNETIVTGAGNDTITGGLGADSLTSGTGSDVFVFNAVGGTSSDSSRVHVTGNGNDRGQDTINGFDFTNDTIRIVATNIGRFQHGIDTRVGSAGASDTGGSTSFTTAAGLIDVSGDSIHDDPEDIVITFGGLSGPLNETAFQARLQYKLTGNGSANPLLGGDLSDVINGGGASDDIGGGDGADILIGGTGVDRLIGNGGADQYWLQLDPGDEDIIEQYSTADRIGLRASDSNFANTVGSVSGTALNAADFATRSTIASMTAADSHKVVLMTTAQAPATLKSGVVDTYVVLFNTAAGTAQIWYDDDWGTIADRFAVAVFQDLTSVTELTSTISLADFVVWTPGIDPIFLDLDDNGFSFAGLEDGRRFDIDGDGTTDTLAWNTSGDATLAMDLNGNGLIDDGSELFTPDFGHGAFATGGEAIASLDANGDGVIDASDAAFGDLLVWRDGNADGVTDAGELVSLSDAGVVSINVPSTPGDGAIDGQDVIGTGSFTRADGSVGGYVEVALETDFGSIDSYF